MDVDTVTYMLADALVDEGSRSIWKCSQHRKFFRKAKGQVTLKIAEGTEATLRGPPHNWNSLKANRAQGERLRHFQLIWGRYRQ